MNYTIIKNKRREKNEIFEIQIICKEDFIPTENQIRDILIENNLHSKAIDIIKKIDGGKVRVQNMKWNKFITITAENYSQFEKNADKEKIKLQKIILKKGITVQLKTGEIGVIIKNLSNMDLVLKTSENIEIPFQKEQVLNIIE